MADFDPYHRWLQIPANEQPANHYRLLGLVLFESDPDVIENAANQRLAHLRTFQSGPNGAISQQIMNEVTQAKLALLVPETKAAYDSQLQAAIEAQRIANEAAANPFSQLNVGGDNPATTGNRIQLPGAESVPTATSRPSLQGAPAFSSATSSATGAAMPKVINRPPKRTAAWILPVAIVGLLLFLLIGIGGAAAFFVLSRSDSDSVAVIDPNKAADSKKIDDKSNEATKSNNQKKQKKNSDQLANAESSGIEILDLFQLPHNLHSGQAEITEAGLVLKNNPCINTVSIPVALPLEYDLKTRITGDGRAIVFGIPVNGHVAHLSIDTYNDKQTGLGGIDGIQIGAKDYPGNTHIGQVIAEGTETNLTISVRERSVKLFRDEPSGERREIYSWTGDSSRLSPHKLYETVAPYRFCPGISTYRGTEFTLHSLKVIPLGEHASDNDWLAKARIRPPVETLGAPVDLLSLYEDKFIIEKPVTPEGDGVEVGSTSTPFAGTMFPYDLPEEYDVDMSVLNGGNRALYISPMIAGKRSAIEVDNKADEGKKTFLSMIDSRPGGGPTYPGYYEGEVLPRAKSVPLKFKIRKNGVRVIANGEEVYRWIGNTDRLGERNKEKIPPEFKNYLGVFAQGSPILIEKLTVMPVNTSIQKTSTDVLAEWGTVNPENATTLPETNELSQQKPTPIENELTIGKAIKMLPLLKFPEDLCCGRAQINSRNLQLESIDSNNIVVFPVMLPQDYDIETQVKRVSPDDSFIFGIHVGGYPCTLAVDGYPRLGYRTGLGMVNGKDIHGAENPGIHKGQLLPQDEFVKLKVRVRKQSVELFVEDKSVYRWQGDPSVLSMHSINQPPYSLRYNLWVGSWKTQYLVNYVHLIPRGTAAETQDWLEKSTYGNFRETRGRPVNLLNTLNADSIIAEPIKKDSRGLIIGDAAARRSGVEFPYELPTDYDIECSLMTGGPNGVIILPVIGGHRAGLYIDNLYRGDSRTALSLIDGHFAYGGYHPGKQPGTFLEKGKLANILCQVRSDGVRLFIDGQYIYGWFGKADRLSPADWPDFETDSLKHLRIVTQNNSVLIRSLAIRPVEVEGRLEPVALLEKLSEINPGMIEQSMIADFARAEEAGFIREPMETEQTDDTGTNDSPFKTNFEIPKLRELNATEKAEMKEIDKAIRSVVSSLEKQDYDKASPVIANAASVATYDETKQKAAALKILKSDVQSFWETVSKTCGDLQAGHEIELSNGVAVVVESSSERIVMQYNGQSIRKAPTELPMGLAMNLVESAITTPSAAFLRSKGSIYFVDSLSNKENREKAGQFWQAATEKGADTSPLMMLLAE